MMEGYFLFFYFEQKFLFFWQPSRGILFYLININIFPPPTLNPWTTLGWIGHAMFVLSLIPLMVLMYELVFLDDFYFYDNQWGWGQRTGGFLEHYNRCSWMIFYLFRGCWIFSCQHNSSLPHLVKGSQHIQYIYTKILKTTSSIS